MTDGKIYFGQFYQEKKEGIGKYIWNDGRVYLGFWKANKQNGLGRYTSARDKKDQFGIWVQGKRTQWINEELLKDESNEYFDDYQQIINFDTNFVDDLDENNIVQDLSN